MEFNLNGLNVCELVVAGVYLLAFLILAFLCSRKVWVATEVFLAFVFGAVFVFFPSSVLGHQLSKAPGELELFLARLYGALLFSTGITWFRTRETRDATVPITLMMSRVFSVSILLMVQLCSFITGSRQVAANATSSSKPASNITASTSTSPSPVADQSALAWSDKYMLYVLPTALWMLGNLVHLLRSHDFSTYPQHNIRLNNLLRIDAWFALLGGIVSLTYPNQILSAGLSLSETPSIVALHIVRCCGALCVGEAVIALQAPGFLHPRDKHALFATRIISNLLQAALLAMGCFVNNLFSVTKLYWVLGAIVPVLVNSVVGLVTNSVSFYTPSRKSEVKSRLDYDSIDGKKLS